jgi:hypothetical protein
VRAVVASVACSVVLGLPACSHEEPELEQRELARLSVVALARRSTTALLELCTPAECVVTTPEHPFAGSTGWVRAGELKVGDTIESAGGSTRVVGTRVMQVPPTAVYNLTIEKTHAYFAGRSGLLVHNADCRSPRSQADHLAEERRDEERTRRHAEEVERDARELRVRRLLSAHRRRLNRVTLNDSPPDAPNCAYCTLGALSDAEKLSSFLRDHGLDENVRLPDIPLQRLLSVLGLTRFQAGPPMNYRRRNLIPVWKRLLQGGADRSNMSVRRYGSQLPEPPAREYMESVPGNTNMVIYRWIERLEKPPGSGQFQVEDMAHALVSVRREDGEIVYLDFQDVPPRVYEKLPSTTFQVVVFPTDVDWRYNRQLYAALRDGEVHPSL